MATNTDGREEIKPVAPTEQTKWRDPSLVGKYMVDPKTGLAGLFRSPNNGETWVLTDTVYGHVYNQDEVDNIWDNGAGHKVADEIKSATADLPNVRKQADEAVKFAESAIAASKVNSDAIVAQSSAVVEAKSAMDSATAEIQQLKANAASDVAQIRVDVAQVQNEVDTAKAANSTSVDKLKSDIGLAQKDLDNVHNSLTKAQSAVEQNQKLINDSVAKINNDIAQNRQDIVTAQQANDDLAKQLDAYSKEAQEQGKTIKTIQDNQGGFSITIADVKGDVTKVSDTVDSLSAGLKDAQGNIANVKAQADQLNATLTDHSKDIAQLTATAKELSSTLEDADGRLSKAEQTASEQSTTLSGLQGNLTQVKQTADNLVTTLKDAQGNIDQIRQDAKGTLEQLSNAQGDIAALQKDVSGIKLTIADHDKNIHTLQADSKTLKDDMADAKGNISSLQKTSTSLVGEFKDHDGRLSKVEQTATEHTSELADTKGNIDKVTQKANTLQLLLSDAQKNIQNIQLDAKGLHDTLTGQSNQLASLNVTLNNLDSKYSGITGDLQSKQTALSTEQQQTKDMLLNKADKSEVDNVKGTVNQVSAEQKVMADQISQKVSSAEYQTLKDKVNGMKIGGRNLLIGTSTDEKSGKSYNFADYQISGGLKPNTTYTLSGWARVDQKAIDNNQNVFVCAYSDDWQWSIWLNITKSLTSQYGKVTFTTPSGKELRNNVTVYLSHPNGDSSQDSSSGQGFISKLKLEEGNVATDWTPAPEDTITAIQKNATAIDENSKLISLMAKQTEVDNVKNTAQQISSRLDILAGEVKSKVDETRVNNIVDSKGYATTSTVQSLVDQKAGTINESITNLTSKVNSNNGGGVNLQGETNACSFPIGNNGNTTSIETYSGSTKMIHAKNGGFYTSYDVRSFVPTPGETYTLSADVKGDGVLSGGVFKYEGGDNGNLGTIQLTKDWKRISNTVHIDKVSGQWIFYPSSSSDFYLKHLKIERGSVATPWTPAPSDNATVTQVQQITASIDGLQSRVTNYQNDTSSKYTQLSDLMQSKVGTADFDNLKRAVDMQTLDSADINNMKTNGHYFVHNLTNSPIAGWVYVDVTGNGNDRIRQDVYQDGGNQHKYRRWFGTYWTGWDEGATYTEITQLQDALNLRVQKGELLSQINLTAGNTLIQSNKLYLDASSVVFSGRAFIPSAAIASLSADKINTGTLNTDKISLSNGHVRLSSDDDHFYVQTEENAVNNPTTRFNFDGIDFMDSSYGKEVPQYSIGYDTSSADRHLYINAFDHFNSGGTTASQLWYSMVPAISLNNQEINFAAKGNMHMQVVDGGVNIKPTLFFQNNTNNGTYAGFTRLDNSDTVEFNTGNNNGENFHVNSGARFMKYVYFNDYCRAQGWLTYSTLSKKTNIKKLDTSLALDKIRQDDQYLYEYKRNVAKGVYDPQASFIIDDVNDVSHYSVPREFIDQTGKYREPSVELSYLIAAFQEIDKQVQTQKEEIKELKEKLQHE
ncbi:chromosome partitioning protein ParA [Limosilactobacillus reuteri]|uniref:chromosome partitioning protein ParA n=5 Tax=Limosilactobacillus reuteri TaxID=1598 RepID=UPI001E2D5695|nr:chromosome partitioning protein ParA [Limosilactobacillus reuteri]MCC4346959.1 chromosome partitioning protein ParA [Limosilactobacillus reuteri]MCC4373982.1 chromosome partitioning protein ParA [Limosilactobacillus reuteri]MCC4386510.1 chromosome partitioning protein ParA [Limosilactobacillus reuteri]